MISATGENDTTIFMREWILARADYIFGSGQINFAEMS
jgi:hypothetical protein